MQMTRTLWGSDNARPRARIGGLLLDGATLRDDGVTMDDVRRSAPMTVALADDALESPELIRDGADVPRLAEDDGWIAKMHKPSVANLEWRIEHDDARRFAAQNVCDDRRIMRVPADEAVLADVPQALHRPQATRLERGMEAA